MTAPTRILGISCHYHDASAALLEDGRIVAAADQERFTRVKHDPSFPYEAIDFCLERAGVSFEEIDAVAFYEKPLVKFERLMTQHAAHFPRGFATFRRAMPSWIDEKLRLRRLLKKEGFEGEVFFLDHHLSHAAAAFYPSPFEEAAVLTVDGVGEWATTSLGVGRGTSLALTHEIRFPHSIGLLYSTLTAYLGFSVNNSEYKVMGLSAYGAVRHPDPSRNPWVAKLRRVIDLRPDGSFKLDLSYFDYEHADRMPSKKLWALLGGPPRRADEPVTERHEDIAAALQHLTEEAVFAMMRHLRASTGLENLVFSGGVALNSVLNGKILERTGFKDFWVQPNAGDAGSSLGAALHVWHALFGNPRNYRMENPYLGPEYSDAEIGAFVQENGIAHRRYADDASGRAELLAETARRLLAGEVIGWFQGRMEWGPRALGARSLLADASNPGMREILNAKVKHRELFRPFAPAVRAEDATTLFECAQVDGAPPTAADFMLTVHPVRPEWRERLVAVTHVDGSARLQTVRRATNPLFHDLLTEMGRRGDVPALINTSFNIRGEPIVCTPEHAYRCMMGTAIDALVIGNYCITRNENLKDAWESGASAED